MAFTITSWNIQNASLNSLTTLAGGSSGFGEYVGALLAADAPAIVGLMEVRQGQGDTLAPLVNHVNTISVAAGAGGGWQGCVSCEQDDKLRRESSIYLWNSNLAVPSTTAMPGPFFNVNVIDANATQNVFSLGGVTTAAQQAALTTWLTASGQAWTQFQYQPRNLQRLRIEAANWLGTNASLPSTSGLPAPPNNSSATAYADAWYKTLKGIDFVLFTKITDRSPFVGQFTAPGGGTMLTTALLHAPNPSESIVGSAGNAMSQSVQLGNAAKLVIMGDFNIQRTKINTLYPAYGRSGSNWTANGWHPPFLQLTAAPFSVTRQMGSTNTSLSSSCPTAAATSTDARAEPYDLFLTRGASATATYAARDLIAAAVVPANLLEQDMISYAQQSMVNGILRGGYATIADWIDDKRDTISRATIRFNKQIGPLTTTITNLSALANPTLVQQTRLTTAQARLAKKQAQVAQLANWDATCLALQGKLGGGAGPYTVAMAWMLIRWGIADHLPIVATGV